MDYRSAGVDLDKAEEAVAAIKDIAASTHTGRVLSPIGGFGGLYDIAGLAEHPVLVSTTDGVGTKIELARAAKRWRGLGADLVAMCVDDLVCTGARPLFFLDYIAVGKNDPGVIATVVAGIADALKPTGASLVGGEIAEHPGVMEEGQIDLAGFAVGVLEAGSELGPQRVRAGDTIVAIPSPNLRSNGFSLVRAIYGDLIAAVAAGTASPGGQSLFDSLAEPSVIYAPSVLPLVEGGLVAAAAHITGGGIAGNLSRVIPDGLAATVDPRAWRWPAVFEQIAEDGGVPLEEMRSTFNLGVGMALIVRPEDAEAVTASLPGSFTIGRVEPAQGGGRAVWS